MSATVRRPLIYFEPPLDDEVLEGQLVRFHHEVCLEYSNFALMTPNTRFTVPARHMPFTVYEYSLPVTLESFDIFVRLRAFLDALLTPDFVKIKLIVEEQVEVFSGCARFVRHIQPSDSQNCRSSFPINSLQRKTLIDMFCNRFLLGMLASEADAIRQCCINVEGSRILRIEKIYILVFNKGIKSFLRGF